MNLFGFPPEIQNNIRLGPSGKYMLIPLLFVFFLTQCLLQGVDSLLNVIRQFRLTSNPLL